MVHTAGTGRWEHDALFRLIKDAVDCGVAAPHKESKYEANEPVELGEPIVRGRARLAKLVTEHREQWANLPNRCRDYRMRPGIDRRFFGPKHLRTRDFGDSDDDEYEDHDSFREYMVHGMMSMPLYDGYGGSDGESGEGEWW